MLSTESTRQRAAHPPTSREASVWARWIVPILRVTGTSPADYESLLRAGVTLHNFADPKTRIGERALHELLESAVERSGDPRLGLRAGQSFEPGDYDVVESAARACARLGDAIACLSRYLSILHGGLEAKLIEAGGLATWRLRGSDDAVQPSTVNDFAISFVLAFVRRYTAAGDPPVAVHFQHAKPTCSAEYARVFASATVRFGMPHNALVFRREQLAAPMLHACSALQSVFELRAALALEHVLTVATAKGRVRDLLSDRLVGGDARMAAVAGKLGMSVPTLRRRLRDEGTGHAKLVDGLRRELAEVHLHGSALPIGEIASLLGFAHVTAFHKAFGRWYPGLTPGTFRAAAKGEPPSEPVPPPVPSVTRL
ncbi:MAG: Transcriptional regulator, AraC family [Myxococcaceae bacterium]|nr:Transcriptional regulator, AraC family [Myxococcaceae bacterium]